MIDGRREEFRSAFRQLPIGGVTIGHADDQLGAHALGIYRRREFNRRFVLSGAAAGNQEEPVAKELQDARAPVLW